MTRLRVRRHVLGLVPAAAIAAVTDLAIAADG